MEKTVLFQKNRLDDRAPDELRHLKVTYDIFPYAAGSVLFEMGKTKVLCSVTLQSGVPHFLRGKRRGWLTAEYSLLPASTPIRTVREVTANKRNGRTIEISRLIGRSLRSVCNLQILGEQTIFIDCDVLQADGGTRTACITGSYLALKAAQTIWLEQNMIPCHFLKDELVAVSVGVSNHGAFLDLDFAEDNAIDADFNFVLTRGGGVVEVQGAAEKEPLTWEAFENMKNFALKGATDVFEFFDMNPYRSSYANAYRNQQHKPYAAREQFE